MKLNLYIAFVLNIFALGDILFIPEKAAEEVCSERLFIPDFEQGKFLSFPRIK